MTKILLFIFLFTGLAINAQQKKASESELKIPPPPPPGVDAKIFFSYDNQGNQIERKYCLGCSSRTIGTLAKKGDTLKEENLQTKSLAGVISYFPNPVKDELYLEWETIDDNTVISINVYGMNGQLLKTYFGNRKVNFQNIAFHSYPSGVYAVVLLFNNGEQNTIKIIKQ
jgi:hypothetical protein